MALSRLTSSLLRAFRPFDLQARLGASSCSIDDTSRLRVTVQRSSPGDDTSASVDDACERRAAISVVESDESLRHALHDGDDVVLLDFRLLRRVSLGVDQLARLVVAPSGMDAVDLSRAIARFALWRAAGGETRAARAWFRG
jgi:hypothetical protein